jgi:hypothetical protein
MYWLAGAHGQWGFLKSLQGILCMQIASSLSAEGHELLNRWQPIVIYSERLSKVADMDLSCILSDCMVEMEDREAQELLSKSV